MGLEQHHIHNRIGRCVKCTKAFADRDRVHPSYVAGELGVDLTGQPEVGLLQIQNAMNDARPLFRHVVCEDPSLRETALLPSIHYCIKCRLPLSRKDLVSPVFQVVNPKATSPTDPTDQGVEFGDRIHFAHIDCKDAKLARTSALIV